MSKTTRKAILKDAEKKKKEHKAIVQSNQNNSKQLTKTATVKDDAYQQLVAEMLSGNASLYSWLASLVEPGLPGTPPLMAGPWVLDSAIVQYEYEFTLVAGANGVIYAAIINDAWVDEGTLNPERYRKFSVANGTSAGGVIWTSGVNASGTPGWGTAANADHVQLPLQAAEDISLTPGMEFRMLAGILEAWPDVTSDVGVGTLMAANVAGPAAQGVAALNAKSPAMINTVNQDFVNHTGYEVAGWQSGHALRTHLVPVGSDNLTTHPLGSLPDNLFCGNFGCLIMGYGMTPGQKVHFKGYLKYEVSTGNGKRIDYSVEHHSPAQGQSYVPATQALALMSHTKGPKQIHSIRPILAMEAVKPGSTKGIGPQLMGGFQSLLSTGLKAASGFLPGIIGAGAKALMGLFG